MNRCSSCKLLLNLTAFSRNRTRRDGLSNQCKSCMRVSISKSESKNPDKYELSRKQSCKRWRDNNQDKVFEQRARYKNKHLNDPEIKIRNAWYKLNRRCSDKADNRYNRYGNRGIRIEWNNYEEFKNDMLGSLPKLDRNFSIERINNDGNYSKTNCRWATAIEQANNRHTNVFIEHNGKRMTLAQWARYLNLNYKTFHKAITYQGKSIEYFIKKEN